MNISICEYIKEISFRSEGASPVPRSAPQPPGINQRMAPMPPRPMNAAQNMPPIANRPLPGPPGGLPAPILPMLVAFNCSFS